MELVLRVFADNRQDPSHGSCLVRFQLFSLFTRSNLTLDQLKSQERLHLNFR